MAIAKFVEFDQAMSLVQAGTRESADNMALLREAALDAGARTVFSATEAANAIEELGKAGVSTQDILAGGLDGALDLAAAGGLGVAEAAGIAAVALKTFNLRGTDMSHVADLLAAGAGKAMGDVTDLSAALNQSAQVANQTGLSIDETTAALAAFASQGLLGSDAGTSFKSMLQRLTPQSAEAEAKMRELGISAYDAQGNFIGLSEFAGNLQNALKDLTPEQRNAAMATIFGSDAVRAATVLYSEGADGISDWTDKVNDQGYAAEQAAIRLDNLSGDVEALGGAFDTALIRTGSPANDALRAIVQSATGAVTAFGDLPEPVLATALVLGALVAVIGVAGGAALLAVPKIAEFKAALIALNISGASAARGIGLTAGALGLGIVAFSLWASRQAEATANASEFQDSLDKTTGALTGYTRELVAKKLADAGAYEAAKEAGISQKELTDAVIEGGKALDDVEAKLGKNNTVASFFSGVGIRAGIASQNVRDLSGQLETSQKNFKDQQEAPDGAATSTQDAADAYLDAGNAVDDLQGKLMQLIDTVNEANGVNQDAISANSDYQEALAAADEQIRLIAEGTEGYAATLDLSTQAGRDNSDLLLDLASKSQDAAKAQFDLDGNTANYKATLEAGRQAVYDRALALTGNADAAQLLTDKIYAIPTEREFTMIADTADAQNKISALADTIAFVQRKAAEGIRISATVTGVNTPVLPGQEYAYGGYTGPGDKFVPRGIVHADEFVSTKETLAHPENRRALDFMHDGGIMYGFADGGPVSALTAPDLPSRPLYAGAPLYGHHAQQAPVTHIREGDTYSPTFQLTPLPGRSLPDQVFEASRRLKARRN
nr:phage tail tape measure protein [Plantibacter sp. CFBP 8804]